MDEVVEALEKYKGLVPLVYDIETMSLDEARPEDMQTAVYLKREADKVIAELERKVDLNKRARQYWRKECILEFKENRHNKYKRCLAMARWCGDACDKWMMRKAKAIVLGKDGVEEYHRARRKLSHYMRWQNRWMKLAEKFKEAK